MNIIRVILEHKDGSQYFTTNTEDIIGITTSLPKNMKWLHTANTVALSNKYFAMLTELNKHVKTGYTKADLHIALKPLIFTKFADFKHYFKDNTPNNSTTNLTYEGWLATIEQLKVVANDVFGYIFKE